MKNFHNETYSLNKAKLYCNDVIEVLKGFEDEIFDVIFADPPYNLSNGGTSCHGGKRVNVNKGDWDKSRGVEKDIEFHTKWITECRRILKNNGTIWISGTYHNIFTCGYILINHKWHILNDIIWYKSNAAPNLACRMFTASHETLLWAKKNKNIKHYFNYEEMKHGDWHDDKLKTPDKQMRSVWSIGYPKNNEKIYGKHPTQKPLALLERIIIASCPPEGIVLDPFCGSATTGVAALSFGARFVGIDSDQSYLEKIAIPRLQGVQGAIKNEEAAFSILPEIDFQSGATL